MYNPKKGEVHYQQLWSIIETVGQRFIDIDKKAMLQLIKMPRPENTDTWDIEKEYNKIVDKLYAKEIDDLIADLNRCVEK